MKTETIYKYSYDELGPQAQERVLRDIGDQIMTDPDNFTLVECVESLKAIADECGVKLVNWNIGPYNRNNYVKLDCDLDGHKALACFAGALYRKGYERKTHFRDIEFSGICGFTGLWSDELIAECILGELLRGESMQVAFDHAGDFVMRICEEDLEYRASKEGILGWLDTSEENYSETGGTFWTD